jgi:hypothetical protein
MPTLRSRFPLLHRFAIYLALLAILVPLGTSLVHYPAAAQAFTHICGIDTHAPGDQSKDPAHKLPSCPICQSLHLLGGGFVPPEAVAVADRPVAVAIYISADVSYLLKLVVAPQARPRAPPLLA